MNYLETGASVSEDGLYRYSLVRRWADGPSSLFIGLNPSTADALVDDPTVRRCVGFARDWGCGAIALGNLFAYRATSPTDMKRAADPVGPDNDRELLNLVRTMDPVHVVACWGSYGSHMGRDRAVANALPCLLQCLGKTKDGHPRHPLYLPRTTSLEPLY